MPRVSAYPDGVAGHVVHMSLGADAENKIVSVALCDCGWEHRVPWLHGAYREQDAAVEAHWQSAEQPKKKEK